MANSSTFIEKNRRIIDLTTCRITFKSINNCSEHGTGVIIKNKDKFYVFTAKHCLVNLQDNNSINWHNDITIYYNYNFESKKCLCQENLRWCGES